MLIITAAEAIHVLVSFSVEVSFLFFVAYST